MKYTTCGHQRAAEGNVSLPVTRDHRGSFVPGTDPCVVPTEHATLSRAFRLLTTGMVLSLGWGKGEKNKTLRGLQAWHLSAELRPKKNLAMRVRGNVMMLVWGQCPYQKDDRNSII